MVTVMRKTVELNNKVNVTRGGCVTAKVRSRVTDGLILKIEKNVKIAEIDHNGAYQRICEYFKTLFVPSLIDLSSDSGQKNRFKVSEKWCLLCFVLSTSRFRRNLPF